MCPNLVPPLVAIKSFKIVTKYNPGMFCWVDLATTDAGASKRFYTELMGWTANDSPVGDGMVYTILQKGGKNVCGLYGMDGEMIQQGVPPHWQSYVCVESADRGAEKVGQSGGTVVMPPMDVMDLGRMAVVQDPTGAVFSLWEPRAYIGADIIYEPGALGWNELVTRDLPAASRFYTSMFGWSGNKMKGPSGEDYTEFKIGEQPVGGMLEIKQEWGEVPPNWAVYFCVEDCDATLQKAESLRASVVLPAMELGNVRIAFLKDPQDVYFGIAQVK
jgi:hypothetical protein